MGDLDGAAEPATLVLACLEAGLPVRALYRHPAPAYVVRNAGGTATRDAIRSILAGRQRARITRIVLLGHTRCRLLEPPGDRTLKRLGAPWRMLARAVDGTRRAALRDHLEAQVAVLRREPALSGVRVEVAVYDDDTGALVSPS